MARSPWYSSLAAPGPRSYFGAISFLPVVPALVVALSATCAIAAACRGDRRSVFVFKPLTTLLVIAAALWAFGPADPRYQRWIVLGLVCSLAGDVCLMLGDRTFLAGLASFLVAQLVYARAFTLGVGLQAVQLPWLVPFAFFALVVVIVLWRGLPGTVLRGAVVAYAAAIALMAWRAAARLHAPAVPFASGALALAGACLFLASDATLAVNRFRWPFRLAKPVTDGTYWAAQLLIALSVRV